MRDDRFEWDDAKAANNVVKHKLTFDEAKPVFDDPGAVTYPDDDPDEDREITIGYAGELLLFVVSTDRTQWPHPHHFSPASDTLREAEI